MKNIGRLPVQFKSTNANSISGVHASTEYKMQRAYGLSVLPGYLYHRTAIFYARLGYMRGNFKSVTTDASLANINRYLNGFCYGLGIDYLFTQHITARLEYNQTAYQNTSFFVVSGAASKTTNIHPFISQALFGLIYHF